jgi:hypothetical protein
MPFVPGVTAAVLAKSAAKSGKPIPLPVVLRIVCDALSGLAAAHEAKGPDGAPLGVIHRDVSPQNFLVGTDGMTRLLDFGVAKARGRLQKTTRDGALKGKLAYMSPEQAPWYGGRRDDRHLRGRRGRVGARRGRLALPRRHRRRHLPPCPHRRGPEPHLASTRRARGPRRRAPPSPLRGAWIPIRFGARDARCALGIVPPATHTEVAALVRELCSPLVDAQAAAVRDAEAGPEPATVVDRPAPSVPVLVSLRRPSP